MKTSGTFLFRFVVLVLLQVLVNQLFQLTPLLHLTLLPALLLCLPADASTPRTMTVAFVMALAVDFLSDGFPGLTAAALVPAAAVRRSLLHRLFGEEAVERGRALSFRRDGILTPLLAAALLSALYLLVYVWLDGAACRSFGYNLLRWLVSLAADSLLALPVLHAGLSTWRDER